MLLLAFCFLPISVSAAAVVPEDFGTEQAERALPDGAIDAFGRLTVSLQEDLPARLEQLWTYIMSQGKELLQSGLRNACEILALAYLTAICRVFSDSKWIPLCGAIVLSVLSLEHVSSCLSVGLNALNQLRDFSMVLLPCLSTAAAVSGAVTSAGVKYAGAMLYFDGILRVMSDFAVPVLYAYVAVMLSANLTEHPLLQATATAVKQVLRWALIMTAVGFTLYLSLTGLLSGTVDAAAVKTAKTVLSSALPVVGGILSDASSALLSGAAMVRNGIGVFGMLAVSAACAVPFLTLGLHYLIFRAAAILAQSFCEKPISGLLNGFGDVYAFLLGMVGTATLMVYVSVISMMKAVSVG